jgi:16S rRNA (cytidine1402-2'-O)-methyltransferase
MGTLYLVGTPIGNLGDVTFRAARVLGLVHLIAAEDTRVTRKLTNHLGIHTPLISFNKHNEQSKVPTLLTALQSGDVALVSDAGMPGISDPGGELVLRVTAAGFKVEVIPGVSAITTALAASGLSGDAFLFLGFLPRRSKERRALLQSYSSSALTLVIFEAPHRLRAALADLLLVLGDRQIAVCRELTKLYEEVCRSSISEAIDHFTVPRGEFVLIVPGAQQATPNLPDLDAAQEQLVMLREAGMHAKEAVAAVAGSLGIPKKEVYRLWVLTAQISEKHALN